MELLADQIFCFTPKGDIVPLPRGSSPLDLAYAVHSSIGNRCAGARVNGRLQSIHAVLRNGDRVEVLVSSQVEPQQSWLALVASGRARAELRRFFNAKRRAVRAAGGDIRLPALAALPPPPPPPSTVRATAPAPPAAPPLPRPKRRRRVVSAGGMAANGSVASVQRSRTATAAAAGKDGRAAGDAAGGPRLQLAKCCRPVPGDPIAGVLRGGGPRPTLCVHREGCRALQPPPREGSQAGPQAGLQAGLQAGGEEDERRVAVRWGGQWAKLFGSRYEARLKLRVDDAPDTLAAIAAEAARTGATLSSFRVLSRGRKAGMARATAHVEVTDLAQLLELMRALRTLSAVRSVERG